MFEETPRIMSEHRSKIKKEHVRGEMCGKYVSGVVRRAYVRVMRKETPRSM